MLQQKTVKTEVGVIIGRFQVHELHKGHDEMIKTVLANHKKVIIMIGSTPSIMVTRQNPLDYQTRMLMLAQAYPSAVLLPLKDCPTDEDWSRSVDQKIEEVFDAVRESKNATIYGSRDGFMPHYTGKYPTIELDATVDISGTEVRQMVSEEVRKSSEFRRGVIYAAYNKHLTVFPTVDIACIRKEDGRNDPFIAMVRKKSDPKGLWRFPGGFVKPDNERIDDAAKMEFGEETSGMEAANFRYLQSFKCNDWRYRKESDSIMTFLFLCDYVFGELKASDDVDYSKWVLVTELEDGGLERIVIPGHRPLMRAVLQQIHREANL